MPNRTPLATDAIPAPTVGVGETATVDVAAYFTDADGDALTYTATSSNEAAVVASVAGSVVSLAAIARGTAVITVTATDPEGLSARQGFEVTVPNQAPVAVGTIEEREVWVDSSAVVDMAPHFSDPDGDVLTYAATSSTPGNASVSVSESAVTVRGVSEGDATVTVTARDQEGLTAEQGFVVTVSELDTTFDLEIMFTASVSSTVRAEANDAKDRWEAVLEDTELVDLPMNRTVSCFGVSNHVSTVDDVMVFVHVDSIDGGGRVSAVTESCHARSLGLGGFPLVSTIKIDEEDLEELVDEDALFPVMFHEMGHALGFPNIWRDRDLLDTRDAEDPHFEGDLAIEAFDAAGGGGYAGEKVPVQLAVFSHWRESVFGDEIMSPHLSPGDDEAPISAITLQSFADIGYRVDVSRADDYELPASHNIQIRGRTGRIFDLSNDIVWGAVNVIDAGGRVIRVIPPPSGFVDPQLPWREAPAEPRHLPGRGSPSH